MFFAKVSQQGMVEAALMGSSIEPDGMIEISEADYIAIRSGGTFRIVDGKATAQPVEPVPVVSLRTEKLDTINGQADFALASLFATYPSGEIQSWNQQAREAEALEIDKSAASPLLEVIASTRGLTVTELAKRVREKVAAYTVASGKIIGQRQALVDALMAIDLQAPNAAEQIAAITWPDE